MSTTNFFFVFFFSFSFFLCLSRYKHKILCTHKTRLHRPLSTSTLCVCILFFFNSQRDWDKQIKKIVINLSKKKNTSHVYSVWYTLNVVRTSYIDFHFKITHSNSYTQTDLTGKYTVEKIIILLLSNASNMWAFKPSKQNRKLILLIYFCLHKNCTNWN